MPAISYEVTATVREDLCDAFEAFMKDIHIPDVMATGAFSSASFARIGPGRYRTTYLAESRETLDKYLIEHAPRLREHVAEIFPAGLEFSREEWNVIATF